MSNAAKALAVSSATEVTADVEVVDLTPEVKVKKRLTAQMLKMEEGRAYILRFDAPMFEAEPLKPRKNHRRRNPQEPKPIVKKYDTDPMLCDVTYFGPMGPEQRRIIVYSVLEGDLDNGYPDDAYVGKTFRVVMHRLPDKKYATFQVDEVEEPQIAAADVKRLTGKRK